MTDRLQMTELHGDVNSTYDLFILCMSLVPISTWIMGILTEIFQAFLQNIETYLIQCHILESSKLEASDSLKPFYRLHAIKS